MRQLHYIISVYIFLSSTITCLAQPAAPTEVKITMNESTKIVIEWIDNAWDEDGYFIERSSTNNFSSSVPQFLEANSTSYTDQNILPSTIYYYRVGAGSFSTGVSYSSAIMVTSATASGIPLTPSNLSLQILNATSVSIQWSDLSSNENGFIIERKRENEVFTELFRAPYNSEQFTDTTLLPETTYHYRIAAYNATGVSNYCTEKFCITPPLPAIPTDIKAIFNHPNKIEFSWVYNASDEEGFIITRSESYSQQEFITIDTLNINSNHFIDTTIISGKNYYYKILVYGTNGKNSTDIITVLATSTAIDLNKEQHSASILLYPNPAIDYLKMENSIKVSKWYIIDTNRKIMMTCNDSEYIDISILSNGIYFLTSPETDALMFIKE